jgi:hypothetical protein
LIVEGSWFMVHGSWFMVRGSWFVVHGSWFMVDRSGFGEESRSMENGVLHLEVAMEVREEVMYKPLQQIRDGSHFLSRRPGIAP